MATLDDFYSEDPIAWCPGCGNFSILKALKQAFVELGKEPHEIVIVSGIGQAPKTPHYLRCNTFNGLHGRTLPVATGIKLANHALTVLAEGGDGDGYAEGGNHFLHAMRRNTDLTYLVHNNQVYGLTKGQASPTSGIGFVTGTTPQGVMNTPINPLALAVASKCGFAARGFAGDIEHLSSLIQQGIQHNGFSLIDILQPCVTFNRVNTYKWYQNRVFKVEENAQYDPTDQMMAFEKALEWGDKIPIGIIYTAERSTLNGQIAAIREQPLALQTIDIAAFKGITEAFS